MDFSRVLVADIETKGLLDVLHGPEDFHVMSVGFRKADGSWGIKSSPKEEDVRKVFENPDNIIVLHNCYLYDIPAIEKMFGFKVLATCIDSLPLAWYLLPGLPKYGLEFFGERYNVPKPTVLDWNNQPYEVYEHRCQEDVKINIQLWEELYFKLCRLYESNPQDIVRLIYFLNFNVQLAYQQGISGITVDVIKLRENISYFESMKEEKIKQLVLAMPKVPVKKVVNFPKKGLYKKDGTLSEAGKKYLQIITACGLEESYEGPVEVITHYEDPNPNSVPQKKAWLYSLNWKPQTFKHNRDKKTGEVSIVEQIMTEEKMLCPSVLRLVEREPAIEALDGLTVLTHRLGLLRGFEKALDSNNKIYQGLSSLAVSTRWMHRTIVNLPKYTGTGNIRDGKWIRECLVPGEGNIIVQSDLSGIESRTSDHYTIHINPERVEKTKGKYFDPHTEVAVSANLMTADEEIWFKYEKELKDLQEASENFSHVTPELFGTPGPQFYELMKLEGAEKKAKMNELKASRSRGKVTNYSSLYLVGPKTLSRSLEISEKEAKKLITAYWEVNYAVKVASENFVIKELGGENWAYNPISKFWMYCRDKRNVFSVINQSSAVFCFNVWVMNCTKQGIWPVTQSHDDQLYIVKESEAAETVEKINRAMELTNQQLKLNVELACETQTGYTLAETH